MSNRSQTTQRYRLIIQVGLLVLPLWLLKTIAILTGGLPDADDYMRLVQVTNWLDGQSWNSFIMPRLNPTHPVTLHWSRLADIPLAAVIIPLRLMLPGPTATLVAATVVPLLTLALLATVCARLSTLTSGRSASLIGAVILLTAGPVVFQVSPGRVDHHGWQLTLAATALLGISMGLIRHRWTVPGGLISGGAMAVGLAIGVEVLPWLATLHLAIWADWLWTGRPSRLRLGVSVAGTTFFGSGLLVIAQGAPVPAEACDQLSASYILLLGSTAVAWIILAVAGRRDRDRKARLRSSTCALAAIAPYLHANGWPCIGDPYAALPIELRSFWLTQVQEARPLLALVVEAPLQGLTLIYPSALAIGLSLWRLRRTEGYRAKAIWRLLCLLSLAMLVGSLWQIRVLSFAALAAVPSLTFLASSAMRRLRCSQGLVTRCLYAGTVMAAIPAVSLMIGNVGDSSVKTSPHPACALAPAIDRLTASDLAERQMTIATFIDYGAPLLFGTSHAVLAAPYHRGVEGMLAVHRLFSAPAETASVMAAELSVDLVLVCLAHAERHLHSGGAGSLIELVAAGHPPPWLEDLPITGDSSRDLRLYRVR